MGKVGWMPIDGVLHGHYNPRSMAKFPHLLSVEEKAQEVVERSISRLLGESTLPGDIARALVKSVDLSKRDGNVADRYWVYLSSAENEELLMLSPDIEEDLARFLSNYTEDVGLTLQSPIKVRITVDGSGRSKEWMVVPGCSLIQMETTKAMPAVNRDSLIEDMRSLDAFLIDGARHIPLDRPTISIGRHLDNDIIVESGNISRRHAQIRWRHGKFVIHDLGSKVGTRKNGLLIRESVLSPGDVIKIGDNAYVYGEGLTPVEQVRRHEQADLGQTQALDGDKP